MPLVHHKEIVEVAADLLCGVHGRENIKFLSLGKRWKNTRQHIRLNTRGDGQFGVDALFFRRYRGKIFGVLDNILFHFFDRTRENAYFVPLFDYGQIFGQSVVFRKMLRLVRDREYRIYNAAPQYHGVHENKQSYRAERPQNNVQNVGVPRGFKSRHRLFNAQHCDYFTVGIFHVNGGCCVRAGFL